LIVQVHETAFDTKDSIKKSRHKGDSVAIAGRREGWGVRLVKSREGASLPKGKEKNVRSAWNLQIGRHRWPARGDCGRDRNREPRCFKRFPRNRKSGSGGQVQRY